MSAREGYALMFGSAAVAMLMFAAAVRFRSWPLWLAALSITVLALCLAFAVRTPARLIDVERVQTAHAAWTSPTVRGTMRVTRLRS